jgi:transposase
MKFPGFSGHLYSFEEDSKQYVSDAIEKKATEITEELRREAVRLARQSDRPLTVIGAELGVSETTLRNWLRTVPREKQTATGRVLSLEEQVRQLKKENERLREEREILKKATAFFAKDGR